MKPDIDVCDIDELIKGIKDERVKTALHYAVLNITEAIYETDAMNDVHAQEGSNIMYFVGRQQGLNKALCCVYAAVMKQLGEE